MKKVWKRLAMWGVEIWYFLPKLLKSIFQFTQVIFCIFLALFILSCCYFSMDFMKHCANLGQAIFMSMIVNIYMIVALFKPLLMPE